MEIHKTSMGENSPYLKKMPNKINCLQWHSAEVKHAPVGMDILSYSEKCSIQSLSLGSQVFTMQYHQETIASTISDWSTIPTYNCLLEKSRGKNFVDELEQEVLADLNEAESKKDSSAAGKGAVAAEPMKKMDAEEDEACDFVKEMYEEMFEEATVQIILKRSETGWLVKEGEKARTPDQHQADYHAMVLGLRDYCAKSGFKKVLLGLSGGIDSAIVAVIAADALGAENVRAVMLPSEYTSKASLSDAEDLAQNLGCKYEYVPIAEGRAAIAKTLQPLFKGLKADLTEENVQSRLRGLLLMAISNKFGEMLLTTGNKSEVAVGYATIYGDMAGGYNPIKDLYKTRVFDICRWRNAHYFEWMKGPEGTVIPETIIEKPPSAELRPDQKDSDSLPDYPILDGILKILVDQDGSLDDCEAAGFEKADAENVERLLYLSEYKRFQSAPGTRLSPRAFWLDRRYPIINNWREGDHRKSPKRT